MIALARKSPTPASEGGGGGWSRALCRQRRYPARASVDADAASTSVASSRGGQRQNCTELYNLHAECWRKTARLRPANHARQLVRLRIDNYETISMRHTLTCRIGAGRLRAIPRSIGWRLCACLSTSTSRTSQNLSVHSRKFAELVWRWTPLTARTGGRSAASMSSGAPFRWCTLIAPVITFIRPAAKSRPRYRHSAPR